jgi:hypothetical protein
VKLSAEAGGGARLAAFMCVPLAVGRRQPQSVAKCNAEAFRNLASPGRQSLIPRATAVPACPAAL